LNTKSASAAECGAAPAGGSRSIGFWMCTALVVGNIIGVSIFQMPSALAPYGLNAITGWVVNVVGCLFLALSFGPLSRAFPADDGPYAYIARAFGETTAFLIMWSYWASVWVSNAAIAIGIVGYSTVFFPPLATTVGLPALTALGVLWVFVAVNLGGVRAACGVQMLTTVLKLIPQAAIIILGLWLLVVHPAAYGAHIPPNPPSWREVSEVSTLALFSMTGIECAMIPASRVRDPSRTIPRATLAGTLITGIVYIAISVVPIFLIPQKELAAANAPFADLFARLLGGHYGELVAAFILVSGLGVLNGWTLMAGEVGQSLGRHGGFGLLSRENRRGAPAAALLITGVITTLMLLTNYASSIAKVFALLIVIAAAGTLPMYFACALALIALRWRGEPAMSSLPRRRTIAIATAAVIYCIWVSFGIGSEPLLYTLLLAGAGVPFYLWSMLLRRRNDLSSETA
jgi:basic amino acid/polyamine antiporter, APA family